jgi:hypothetical protein
MAHQSARHIISNYHIEFSACLTLGTAGPHGNDMNLKPVEAAKKAAMIRNEATASMLKAS